MRRLIKSSRRLTGDELWVYNAIIYSVPERRKTMILLIAGVIAIVIYLIIKQRKNELEREYNELES